MTSPITDETRRAELERLHLSPSGAAIETEIIQPALRLMDGPSFVPQYEEIFLYEIYSFPFEGTMPVIIDCGANIGLAVIWWRSKWPEARVVAFEPDPNVSGTLQFNTRYLVGVELHQAAIGDQDGVHVFYAEGTDAGRLDYRVTSSTPELSVEVRSLPKVLEEVGVVDLLKIDIEGAETTALIAAEAQLPNVRRIFVEYHSFLREPQRLGELLELLRRSGYRYYFETQMKTVRPFHGVPVNQAIDLQVNVFAWRS